MMNLRRRYIVINTERSLATAICKSDPHITFEIWREHGHIVTQGMANASLFGHILVSARFETTGLHFLRTVTNSPVAIENSNSIFHRSR